MRELTEQFIKKGTNIALIPARSGSKGVPKKNIRILNGFPLIAYSIIAASLSQNIQRIIVSTDSKEIAEISNRYGAEVPFLRPALISGDNSGDIDFVKHALNWLRMQENSLPEYIIHIRPTTPLRDPAILDKAIEIIRNDSKSTSLRSAHKASESPFKWFLKNEQGYFESIKKGITNEEANHVRQAFPVVYIPDGYIDIIKTEFILKTGILHGTNMLGFESPCCYEVDTEEDFFLLEYQIKKYGSSLYNYLHKKFSYLQTI